MFWRRGDLRLGQRIDRSTVKLIGVAGTIDDLRKEKSSLELVEEVKDQGLRLRIGV